MDDLEVSVARMAQPEIDMEIPSSPSVVEVVVDPPVRPDPIYISSDSEEEDEIPRGKFLRTRSTDTPDF